MAATRLPILGRLLAALEELAHPLSTSKSHAEAQEIVAKAAVNTLLFFVHRPTETSDENVIRRSNDELETICSMQKQAAEIRLYYAPFAALKEE
jgi:hypothetical protein